MDLEFNRMKVPELKKYLQVREISVANKRREAAVRFVPESSRTRHRSDRRARRPEHHLCDQINNKRWDYS